MRAADGVRTAFVALLNAMLRSLRVVLLPHLLACLCLFVLAGYALYKAWFGALPGVLYWLAALVNIVAWGALAVMYAVLLSSVFGIYTVSVCVEDFFYALFADIKEKLQDHINSMQDGVAKQQARVLVRNSIAEVFSPLKNLHLSSVPAAAALVLLSALTFVSRSVFFARLARAAGPTVKLSSVFASRATLVGALLLNLRCLSVLVLWILYAAGILVLGLILWLAW